MLRVQSQKGDGVQGSVAHFSAGLTHIDGRHVKVAREPGVAPVWSLVSSGLCLRAAEH